jgi:membrane associated rhomboid family serine protease
MFLHGSFFHFLFNMFVLWMFGGQLERYWGSREFIKYYFITGIGAGLCTSVVNSSSFIPTIGASGAIYGLLLAYGLTFPNAIIYLYFLLPIKAKYFVLFFGIVEFIASIAPRNDMVAHLAHLGGMLFGLVYLKRKSAVNFALREFRYQTRKLKYHQELKHQSKIERVREEVDFLLDKINKIGFENLSKGERKRLDQASRFLREYSKK